MPTTIEQLIDIYPTGVSGVSLTTTECNFLKDANTAPTLRSCLVVSNAKSVTNVNSLRATLIECNSISSANYKPINNTNVKISGKTISNATFTSCAINSFRVVDSTAIVNLSTTINTNVNSVDYKVPTNKSVVDTMNSKLDATLNNIKVSTNGIPGTTTNLNVYSVRNNNVETIKCGFTNIILEDANRDTIVFKNSSYYLPDTPLTKTTVLGQPGYIESTLNNKTWYYIWACYNNGNIYLLISDTGDRNEFATKLSTLGLNYTYWARISMLYYNNSVITPFDQYGLEYIFRTRFFAKNLPANALVKFELVDSSPIGGTLQLPKNWYIESVALEIYADFSPISGNILSPALGIKGALKGKNAFFQLMRPARGTANWWNAAPIPANCVLKCVLPIGHTPEGDYRDQLYTYSSSATGALYITGFTLLL